MGSGGLGSVTSLDITFSCVYFEYFDRVYVCLSDLMLVVCGTYFIHLFSVPGLGGKACSIADWAWPRPVDVLTPGKRRCSRRRRLAGCRQPTTVRGDQIPDGLNPFRALAPHRSLCLNSLFHCGPRCGGLLYAHGA